VNRQFIPSNLGLGIAWNKKVNSKHQFTLTMDANKLLVPTPDPSRQDSDSDGVPDYQQVSVLRGMFASFGDAPGGADEELQEINFSWGAEYWYNQTIALRTGYFYEATTKGGRQYLTLGVGAKIHHLGIHFSYLVPSSNTIAVLKNTMRFSVMYDFKSH